MIIKVRDREDERGREGDGRRRGKRRERRNEPK